MFETPSFPCISVHKSFYYTPPRPPSSLDTAHVYRSSFSLPAHMPFFTFFTSHPFHPQNKLTYLLVLPPLHSDTTYVASRQRHFGLPGSATSTISLISIVSQSDSFLVLVKSFIILVLLLSPFPLSLSPSLSYFSLVSVWVCFLVLLFIPFGQCSVLSAMYNAAITLVSLIAMFLDSGFLDEVVCTGASYRRVGMRR